VDDLLSPGRAACPVERLVWYSNETLPAEERAAIESHLAHCKACQRDMADWSALRTAMQAAEALTPQPRADLLARIEQRLDVAAPHVVLWHRIQRFASRPAILLTLCRAQVRLIRRDLWWMPLAILPIAIALTFILHPWQQRANILAFVAALITAMGMALLYGQEADPAHEVILAAPTSPHLILAMRCCVVFGYDLLINLAGMLPLILTYGAITPTWLLANWLAPLCCLAAISLLLSVVLNPTVSILVCSLLWGLRAMSALDIVQHTLQLSSIQEQYESFWHQEPLLFVTAALALCLTFICLERRERFSI
jgi:hypothetical protein